MGHGNRNRPRASRWLTGCLIVCWLAAPFPAGRLSGQQPELHQLFPQLDDSVWRDFAEGRLPNRRAFVDDVIGRLENIPDPVWQQALDRLDTGLADACRRPLEYAGQPFEFSGRVIRVAPLDARDLSDGNDEILWNTLIETDEGLELAVLSRGLPRVWQDDSPAGQPVAGRGLLVMMRDSIPVLVASRVAWFPGSERAPLQVSSGLRQLAAAGFDAGLLDQVVNHSDAALTRGEYRMFEQFLAAVAALDGQPPGGPLPGVDLVEVARNPRGMAGELVWLEGELRRITPVPASLPALEKVTGHNGYYQLDVFLPLGNRQVLLQGQQGDPLRLTGSFGVTLLLPELPESLPEARLPVQIEVPAFFLKTWEHKTLGTRQADPQLRKPNPLFVGIPGRLEIRGGRPASGTLGWLIPAFWGGLLVLLLVLLVATRARSGRSPGRRDPPTMEWPGSREPDIRAP